MKNSIKVLALLLLSAIAQPSIAKDGYKIQVKFVGTTDSMVYLAHYYGKPLPTIYKTDSAKIDKKGNAIFQSNEPTLGGIYMLLLSDMKTYFELLLNNGDDMTITADIRNIPDGIVYKNSDENIKFQNYVNFLKGFGEKQQKLEEEFRTSSNPKDSIAAREKLIASSKELTAYRKEAIAKNPNTLLANIFRALETPIVPEGDHFLPNGKKDTLFAYNYFKTHYWDGFDFHDDRLIHTPLYDSRLDEYFNKLVTPYEDSMIKECDWLLEKTRGQKELFKYSLWWLTKNIEDSKIMGMDRVFVYLVENYFMKGDAYWLSNEDLNKYYDRAMKIVPNVIGRVAADIKMKGTDGKEHSLYEIKAKYTMVVFWDPTCGHCQKEIPALDSVYKAQLKAKGVKVFSVRTEGEEKQWKEFIEKNKLNEWTNVFDPEHSSNYRSMYDVYSTPVIYLLDEKKIIRGKRLDHSNVMEVINMLERKEKEKSNKK